MSTVASLMTTEGYWLCLTMDESGGSSTVSPRGRHGAAQSQSLKDCRPRREGPGELVEPAARTARRGPCRDGGFRLQNPDTSVGIDVAYVSAEVIAQQGARTTMIDGVPTLAVEVLSPYDTPGRHPRKDRRVSRSRCSAGLDHRADPARRHALSAGAASGVLYRGQRNHRRAAHPRLSHRRLASVWCGAVTLFPYKRFRLVMPFLCGSLNSSISSELAG